MIIIEYMIVVSTNMNGKALIKRNLIFIYYIDVYNFGVKRVIWQNSVY